MILIFSSAAILPLYAAGDDITYSLSLPFGVAGTRMMGPVMLEADWAFYPGMSSAVRAGYSIKAMGETFLDWEPESFNPYLAVEYRIHGGAAGYIPYIGTGYFLKTEFTGSRVILHGPYAALSLIRMELFRTRPEVRINCSLMDFRFGSLFPGTAGRNAVSFHQLSTWHYIIDFITLGVSF